MEKIILKNKKGFTLIEILIVIVIIGILATLSVVALGTIRAKARDAQRLGDMKQIGTVLEAYRMDESGYPTMITSGNSLIGPTSGLTYMKKIPSDPLPGQSYVYTAIGLAPYSNYSIAYTLEKGVNDVSAGAKTAVPGNSTYSCTADCSTKCTGDSDGCGGTCTVDVSYGGTTYNTVKIGTQCWLKQNLNVGTQISCSDSYTTQNDSLNEKFCPSGYSGNCTTYGGLYTWPEAMGFVKACNLNDFGSNGCTGTIGTPHQGLCPSGYHIPTRAEFVTLNNYLGGAVGKKLQKTGNSCAGGTCASLGASGFDALLADSRPFNTCNMGNQGGFFWTADLQPTNTAQQAYYYKVYSGIDDFYNGWDTKYVGMSVRCIKN